VIDTKRLLGSAIGLTLALASPARAELYTLEQAVGYALAHNPQLAAFREQARAAGAERRVAEGARLPQLDLNYRVRRSDNPLNAFADKLNTRNVEILDFAPDNLNEPDPSTVHATELLLQVPLYTGGNLTARVRGASAQAEAARLEASRAQQLIRYQATRAYLAAQSGAEGLAITNDAVRAAQAHANTTARLVREGRIIVSDKLSADVNLAAVRAAREKARTTSRLALHQLRRVMGLRTSAELALSPWREARTAFSPPALANLEGRALSARLDLQAMQQRLGAAHAQVDAARAGHKPNLNVIASSNWYDEDLGTDSHSWSVMGMASINLFAGGRVQQQVKAERHRAAENEDQLHALRLRIQNEVQDAHSRWQEARARLKIASDNVAKARRSVRLINTRYGQGRTILLDLLQAERALVETRNEALSAALDYETSIMALRLATGELGDET